MTRPRQQPAGRVTRWRHRFLACIVIFAAWLALVGMGYSDRLILYPSTHHLDTAGLQRREVRLPDGAFVEIWTARSPGAQKPAARPRAYVLAFIGNKTRAELTAPFFAHDWGDRPVEVWAVNYPGYGGSPGSARLDSIAPVALAAYDALREHAGETPIFVEARSIGTAAALRVAAHRPVAGCILHNPPPLRQAILGAWGWWNLWLIAGPVALALPPELDSLANAKNVTAPAIFLVAGADGVIPAEYQRMVVDAYAGQKRVIERPGADHTARVVGSELKEYESALDWILAEKGGNVAGK